MTFFHKIEKFSEMNTVFLIYSFEKSFKKTLLMIAGWNLRSLRRFGSVSFQAGRVKKWGVCFTNCSAGYSSESWQLVVESVSNVSAEIHHIKGTSSNALFDSWSTDFSSGILKKNIVIFKQVLFYIIYVVRVHLEF